MEDGVCAGTVGITFIDNTQILRQIKMGAELAWKYARHKFFQRQCEPLHALVRKDHSNGDERIWSGRVANNGNRVLRRVRHSGRTVVETVEAEVEGSLLSGQEEKEEEEEKKKKKKKLVMVVKASLLCQRIK